MKKNILNFFGIISVFVTLLFLIFHILTFSKSDIILLNIIYLKKIFIIGFYIYILLFSIIISSFKMNCPDLKYKIKSNILFYFILIYGGWSIYNSLSNYPGYTEIFEGHYYIKNHGEIIKTLSNREEYIQYQIHQINGSSGFYLSLCLLSLINYLTVIKKRF